MSRFARSSKNCDFSWVAKNCKSDAFCVTCVFSQFFVMLIITKPDRIADLTKLRKNRQSDDFSRYLRFLRQFFVMLKLTFLVFTIT